MVKSSVSLSQVKEIIEKLKAQKVQVTVNLGRNKYETFTGTLTNVYPALFTVSPNDKNYRGKTSYSYSEYMCGKVKIDLDETN